jgi:LuxR family maltose regulon positive regulatory protein
VADKVLGGAAAADDLSVMVALPALEARVALKQGSLRHAVERSASALAGARVLGVPTHIATLDARLASIAAQIERNELPAARDEMPDLWSVLARHGSPAYQVLTGLHEVRLAVVQDGLDAGLDVLREVRAICGTRARPVLQARIDAAEARLRTDTGETRRAEALITRLDTESGVRCLLEARLQVGRGAGREARETLRRAHFTNPHAGLRAELLLVRAALLDGWDPAHHLDRVVELAAPEGFVRTVHEEGDVIRRLVRRAAEASGIPEAETFAEALGAPPNCSYHDDGLVAITVKEREVLRFLPTHLTNKEIAGECFMSVNTVKAHLRSIYAKVNARSRSEAVERARALGVL